MKSRRLRNKVVVVVGGAGLLGQEFSRAIVENGGTVIVVDNNRKIGRQVKSDLIRKVKKNNVDYVYTDITSVDSIKYMITKVVKKYKKIDALINTAYPRNKNYGKHFFEVTYTDFCENININLGGYFLIAQQVASYFEKVGIGNIINISSIYGVVPPRFDIYEETKMTTPVEYAVIKSALIHLTKYIAKYLKNTGIRINSISPGGILNDQPESFLKKYRAYCLSKGMLGKNDINGAVLFLLSDDSKFVNGQNIIVDDGFSL